jgi:hypothetical protein
MRELSPQAEQAFLSLRRHLERSQRFTLAFLSSAYPPYLDEVRRRLDDALPFSASRLDVVALQEASADWVEQLERALVPDAVRIDMRSPLWLALDRAGNDPAMNRLRDGVLAALNEQRTRLERAFRRPLLISLPSAYCPRVWEVAPDLWTIRGIVADFPAPAAPSPAAAPARARVRMAAGEPEELLAVAEWRRVAARASADPESVSPFVAHAAIEAAVENGALSVAMQIAEQGLLLARARSADGSDDGQRDLAIALDDVGQVARELGRLEAAEQAFAESLALRRRLVQAVGESPTALRDLSVSLNNMGQVAREPPSMTSLVPLSLNSFAVAVRTIVTGSGPQSNVMMPPWATAATNASPVQLTAVPVPTTVVGDDTSSSCASGGSVACPSAQPAAGPSCGFVPGGGGPPEPHAATSATPTNRAQSNRTTETEVMRRWYRAEGMCGASRPGSRRPAPGDPAHGAVQRLPGCSHLITARVPGSAELHAVSVAVSVRGRARMQRAHVCPGATRAFGLGGRLQHIPRSGRPAALVSGRRRRQGLRDRPVLPRRHVRR